MLGYMTPANIVQALNWICSKEDEVFDFLPNNHQAKLILLRSLLMAGADLNLLDDEDQTPLMVAAEWNDVGKTKLLLEAGADVNAKNCYGETALMKAAEENVDIVKLLLEAGADVDAKNSCGETALFEATRVCSDDILKVLLEAGADVNVRNSRGETVLMKAARSDDVNIMKLLIEAGAAIDVQDDELKTALMKVHQHSINYTKVLPESEADIEDIKGKTAMDHAADEKCSETDKLLMSFTDQPFKPKRMKRILDNYEEQERENKRQRLEVLEEEPLVEEFHAKDPLAEELLEEEPVDESGEVSKLPEHEFVHGTIIGKYGRNAGVVRSKVNFLLVKIIV